VLLLSRKQSVIPLTDRDDRIASLFDPKTVRGVEASVVLGLDGGDEEVITSFCNKDAVQELGDILRPQLKQPLLAQTDLWLLQCGPPAIPEL
jgi:hypothetical protein